MEKRLERAIRRKLTKSELRDIAMYGAGAGVPGFTYYWETSRFFRKYKAEIVRLAEDMAESLGESVIDFVRGFRCLDATEKEVACTLYGTGKQIDANVANALTWFALETLAYERED